MPPNIDPAAPAGDANQAGNQVGSQVGNQRDLWIWLRDKLWSALQTIFVVSAVPFFAFVAAALSDNYGFSLAPTNLSQHSIRHQPYFVVDNSFNFTRVLFSELFSYHVIAGSHGVGKTTAARMAAVEASKTRAVVYLTNPPADHEFFKHFYHSPDWLRHFPTVGPELLGLYTTIIPNSLQRFQSLVFASTLQPPILVIDNIQLTHNLGDLMKSAKQYADDRLMKIVLVVSSGQCAREMNDFSAKSRATFEYFPGLSSSSAARLLVMRGFDAETAHTLAEQLRPVVQRMLTVPLENPFEFVASQLEVEIEDINACIAVANKFNLNINATNLVKEMVKPCCDALQSCLLTRNVLLYNPATRRVQLASNLSSQALQHLVHSSNV